MPTNTPYSTPSITRGGTLISELNIIVPRTTDDFYYKYNFVPYMMMSQQSKAGSMPISAKNTVNKLFYNYEQDGRTMGFFTTTANSTVAAGATSTLTLSSTSHAASGTRSLPELGRIFFNARTGVEARVSAAANKTVAGAHTVALTPVKSTDNASSFATDEWLDRGFKYVGESSDYTTTTVHNVAKRINYCTQLRKDTKLTDLALAEKTDIPFEGQNYYYYSGKQMKDDNMALAYEKELLLLDSNLTDNLGYSESGTIGLIQQIQANGIANIPYGSFNTGVFATVERQLDAEGAPGEYDWLMDTDQNIEINQSLANEFNNGAILYQQDDLRRGFKSFTPMNRKFNFAKYAAINERQMYGSSGTGTQRDNFGILVPKGNRDMDGDVSANDVSQMIVRYQEFDPGAMPGMSQSFHISESGMFSANGKTTKAEKVISQLGYFGLQTIGISQFAIVKKA